MSKSDRCPSKNQEDKLNALKLIVQYNHQLTRIRDTRLLSSALTLYANMVSNIRDLKGRIRQFCPYHAKFQAIFFPFKLHCCNREF